jgi:hypothetical protein
LVAAAALRAVLVLRAVQVELQLLMPAALALFLLLVVTGANLVQVTDLGLLLKLVCVRVTLG